MHDHDVDDPRDWDEFYAGDGDGARHWSGRPNSALVAEVADLMPRTALDVGCGEGADAIWLARHGWQVTALDPSRVALDRARAAARAAHVDVTWVHAGLLEMPDGSGVHDLVSAHYPVLAHTDDNAAINTLVEAVAPSGTLLFVHHDIGPTHGDEHRFDPADHVMPADIAALLDDGWKIQVHETRPRTGPLPPDTRHVRDLVLRARRRTGATPSAS